ncbi:protein phosphatase inhibitor 2-like isoform X2 [Tigriopus californicus]|uniref:protein phosphatase inhibitor 2-like isoform X2 n=1 Tax=Tigriopus californicus TaxID=6832 RepID=UPI0027DAAD96|nr:protein phosphatase inhibitor 2-like isoform X2 [Tigriopus californicus]|eukprot:TCALIF_09758-PA protein Name:"Similar to Ppp1r2 Protein phosphatase inhibitor 2 (Rattus norvegicus)" AED:0.13 eAED:0.13 QI:0/0/0/1/1/1/3/0/214
MTENLGKLPKRGILKPSTSFEQRDLEPRHSDKNPHFDEQNILETLHPATKDYGFMKIDEPKTPYEYATDNADGEEEAGEQEEEGAAGSVAKADELDAQDLADRIAAADVSKRPRRLSEPSGDEEDLKLLSPEERKNREKFEQKRKAHYNEFYAVKMARQLMEEEGEEEDTSKSDEKDPESQEDQAPEDEESTMDTVAETTGGDESLIKPASESS